MTAVDDLWTLQRARARGLLAGHSGFTFSIGSKGPALVYAVTVVPRKRRLDGTLGKRADLPVYFSGSSTERVLRDAAQWVQRALPEVSQ